MGEVAAKIKIMPESIDTRPCRVKRKAQRRNSCRS